MAGIPLYAQLINLLAAILLLLAFAMLAQRRVLSLVHLFAAQGVALGVSTAIVAFATHQPHLYASAGLTLALKVGLLPWLLHRLIRRLDVRWDVEGLINVPTTMLIGKLAVGGFGLALIETLSAKLRIFRAPEFLGTAFLLAVLAMLVNLLLGS